MRASVAASNPAVSACLCARNLLPWLLFHPSFTYSTAVRRLSLRELCSPAEWDNVLSSASLGRLLTSSMDVLERLAVLPEVDPGKPRAVVSMYARRQFAKFITSRPSVVQSRHVWISILACGQFTDAKAPF